MTHPQSGDSTPPPNHMAGSLLSVLFFLPIGLLALKNSSTVNTAWSAGDHAGAHKASTSAKKWMNVAFAVGGVLIMINVVAILLGVHPFSEA